MGKKKVPPLARCAVCGRHRPLDDIDNYCAEFLEQQPGIYVSVTIDYCFPECKEGASRLQAQWTQELRNRMAAQWATAKSPLQPMELIRR